MRPPSARCVRIKPARLFLRRGVERAGRLVEQPDRAFDGEKAGDRQAPPLAGGKVGGGQVDQRLEPDRGKRLRNLGDGAEKSRPEAEVLADRKRRFQRVLVAEIMGLLADGQFRVAALQIEPAVRRRGPGRRSCAAGMTSPRRYGRESSGPRPTRRQSSPRRKRRGRRADRPDQRRKAASTRSRATGKRRAGSIVRFGDPAIPGMLSSNSCRSGTSPEKTL